MTVILFRMINYLRQCVLSLFQDFSYQPKLAAISHTQRKSCVQRLSLDGSTITVTWQQLVRLQTTSSIDLCLFVC